MCIRDRVSTQSTGLCKFANMSGPVRLGGQEGDAPLLEKEDVYASVDAETDDDELVDFRDDVGSQNLMRNAWDGMTVEWDVWLLLLLVGFITSAICFSVDSAIEELLELRYWLMDISENTLYRIGIWVGVSTFLLTFAWSFTQLVSTEAIGSGIPRMKAILSGAEIGNTLGFTTLVAKVIGLTCTAASGLPIGKEGPFVHIGSCISYLLCRIPAFSRIARHESLLVQALAAGVAVGVSATFGAPIGGVLFAIEVTRIYFLVSNYWISFFCCCCGAFFYQIGKAWSSFDHMLSKTALMRTDFGIDTSYSNYEIICFTMTGVVMGFLAALWVTMHAKFTRYWQQKASRTSYHGLLGDFLLMLFVSIVVGVLTFPQLIGFYMSMDDVRVTNSIFGPVLQQSEGWLTPSIFVTLGWAFVWKFCASMVAITLPIPCGMFMPLFAAGGLLGRLIGETIHLVDPSVEPAAYALVGAAALAGSVTRTVSSAVIVFEVTGELRHIVPVLIAVLVGNAVANVFALSIYDSTSNLNGVKQLAYLRKKKSFSKTARHVMNTDIALVCKHSTVGQIDHVLTVSDLPVFPVCASQDDPSVIGSVERQLLGEFVTEYKVKGSFDGDVNLPEIELRRRDATSPRGALSYDSRLSKSYDPATHDENMMIDVTVPENSGLVDAGQRIGGIPFEAGHQVLEGATLPDVVNQFIMLGLCACIVTRGGQAVGCITRKHLIESKY
eukprot:TRINITY_DN50649_c0_g1_i1.p1 TRINITY_DN50649_c0_g1~~TRINITY_DN50649_c0_g1_i1.p1  ORF type:complete len:723 (-),score=122.33 TRINITY_DN50649_c0_g1_i1:156-2324(-)